MGEQCIVLKGRIQCSSSTQDLNSSSTYRESIQDKSPSTSLRLRIAFPSKFRISNLAQILLPSSLSSFSHHHPQNKPHLRVRRHWRPRRGVNLVLHRTPHKTRRIRCDSSLHRREATLTLSTRSIPARITCNARRTSTTIRCRPGPVPRVVCGCQRRDDGGDPGVTCSARFVAAAVALGAALLGRVLREGWRVGPISLDPGFVTYATSCDKSTNGRRFSLPGSGIVFTAPSSSRWLVGAELESEARPDWHSKRVLYGLTHCF